MTAHDPKIWINVKDKAGRVHQVGVANGVARYRCGSGLSEEDQPTKLPQSMIDPWCELCRKMIRLGTWDVATATAEPKGEA